MRVEEVLEPRGELKDLAPPRGAMRGVCTLSPDAVMVVSPQANAILICSTVARSVDQDPELKTQLLYRYTGHCKSAPYSEHRLHRCTLVHRPITI